MLFVRCKISNHQTFHGPTFAWKQQSNHDIKSVKSELFCYNILMEKYWAWGIRIGDSQIWTLRHRYCTRIHKKMVTKLSDVLSWDYQKPTMCGNFWRYWRWSVNCKITNLMEKNALLCWKIQRNYIWITIRGILTISLVMCFSTPTVWEVKDCGRSRCGFHF